MVLNILLITSLIGCFLDVLTTYNFMKNNEGEEQNILFKTIIKKLGLKTGLTIALALSFYLCFKLYLEDNITDNLKIYGLLFITTTKLAVSYDNYRDKKGYITKIIAFIIPVYWNWKKITKHIKQKHKKWF
mgnify:CR=1 FL=1